MSLLFRWFRRNETRVHELSYLFWECTTRCNLHCRHCGSDCFSASRDKDMPLEDFIGALDTIPRKVRPREFIVVITGGEPLLRPDIAEVGRAICRHGAGWGMVSNGFFYDEAMHAKLMGAGMLTLTISLDGLEAEHNWMRGHPQSFARAVRAIGIAAKERRINFDVVSCINRRNIGQLQGMYELLLSLGVRQWRIFTVIPIGRAKDDPDMHLTDEEFVRLMDFIREKREGVTGSVSGADGVPGLDGAQVAQGVPVADGVPGVQGAPGFCGDPRLDGAQVAQGVPVADGVPGVQGAPGTQGVPGEHGGEGSMASSREPDSIKLGAGAPCLGGRDAGNLHDGEMKGKDGSVLDLQERNLHDCEMEGKDGSVLERQDGELHYAEVVGKAGGMTVTFSCEGYLGRYEKKVRQIPFFCRAGINIASVLIDGRICACPNIDRDAFSQGNIYSDNLYEVWRNRFVPFRNRDWARRGICKDCKAFKDCLGNGMHNWHGDCEEVINCHFRKIH